MMLFFRLTEAASGGVLAKRGVLSPINVQCHFSIPPENMYPLNVFRGY